LASIDADVFRKQQEFAFGKHPLNSVLQIFLNILHFLIVTKKNYTVTFEWSGHLKGIVTFFRLFSTLPKITTLMATPTFSFSLGSSFTKLYGPRLGAILLLPRSDPSSTSQLQTQLSTPTFLTTTSRGVIPHLSTDNQRLTPSIRWINIPFETL